MRRAPACLAVLLLSAPALAQGLLDFSVAQAQSNFTWSGTTSLGAVVGDPSNAFQVAGPQALTLAAGGGPGAQWTGQLTGGDLAVVPDIHGKIPNPIFFLPPLATVRVTNLHLSLASDPFDVAANGAFTALVTATVISGTMTVTPFGSSPTVTDLTGGVSSPTSQGGTMVVLGGGLQLDVPVVLSFDFSDPSSGVSGNLTTTGSIRANWSAPAPVVYCTAKTSSSGCVPSISGSGTPSASAAAGFTISVTQVEAGKVGIFIFSETGPAALPFQGGFLCLSSPITRLPPTTSGGVLACSGLLAVDFNDYLATSQPALRVPGADFCVQSWFRDPPEPISGSGLSDAIELILAP